MKPIIGIGWDVGGWMGRRHGVAAVRWAGEGQPEWIGSPSRFRIAAGCIIQPEDLLRYLLQQQDVGSVFDGHRLVIAFGFPSDFRRFLQGEPVEIACPHQAIDSRLAYRETDRHVHELFGVTPLSAAFDKLGNNTTVAMLHVRRWRDEYGFSILPFDDSNAERVLIEVYPRLVKRWGAPAAVNPLAELLPSDLPAPGDPYDAAICALHALAMGTGGTVSGLPALAEPKELRAASREEGWIYYFHPDVLEA